jgi:glycosyltransferase involved in cell wall biosynthesis
MGQISAFVCGVRRRIAVQHNPVETYPAVARIGDRLLGSIGVYSQNVAVSHAVITSIGQYSAGYRHRTQVIHNAVSVTPTGHIRNDVRARWMIPAASPLLVNVGRLSWQKNQKFLLRLLPRLPGVHLAVIGEGEMKEELIRLAEELSVAERVHFIGEVRPEEANAVVCASDVFVFPSLFEAMPLALLEAMALGVPIVCSDIPSSREFLGSNGILAKLNDPAEWTSAIQMMLDGKGSVSMMVRMALARSAEFTVEKMADGYEALFTTDAPQELSDVVSAERAR